MTAYAIFPELEVSEKQLKMIRGLREERALAKKIPKIGRVPSVHETTAVRRRFGNLKYQI